jgi:hypothetical protein
MPLNDSQRNLLNLVMRCFDRSVGGARLDPLQAEFELGVSIPRLVRDVEVLEAEGILRRLAPEVELTGAESEWLLAPTDRGALLAMGVGLDPAAEWPGAESDAEEWRDEEGGALV